MGHISSRSLVATEEGVEFSLRSVLSVLGPVLSVDHGSLCFRESLRWRRDKLRSSPDICYNARASSG